jgi:site-specific DNA recombinase
MGKPVAAIYTRISKDDDEKKGLGVQRQEQDLRREAGRRGATIKHVFTDNDLSGSGKVVRPQFDKLISAIENGEVTLVLAADLDRLSRGMRPFVRLYEACEKAGIVVAWLGGQANFATGEGLLELEIRASFAREELRKIRSRIHRKHEQLAEQGKSAGGGRPFGYEADRRTVRPEEANLIRDAARRVLEGESMRSVCTDWNQRGIPTVAGAGGWSAQVLRRLLISARISGRREYSYANGRRLDIGKITSDTAEWPGIITRDDSDHLRHLLTGHRRKGQVREYLLTGGMARCGRCHQPLEAHPRSLTSKEHASGLREGRKEMACIKRPGKRNCGRLGILAAPVEDLVAKAIFRAVDKGALARALKPGDDRAATRELVEVQTRQNELADMWAAGEISAEAWKRARKGLMEREDRAQRQIENQRRPRALDGVPDVLEKAWPSLPLHRRRAIAEVLIEAVDIAPATPQSQRNAVKSRMLIDPTRVSVRWRA